LICATSARSSPTVARVARIRASAYWLQPRRAPVRQTRLFRVKLSRRR
jgi:hypothetical protein